MEASETSARLHILLASCRTSSTVLTASQLFESLNWGRVFELFPKSINLFPALLSPSSSPLPHLPPLCSLKLVTSFSLSCTHNLSAVSIYQYFSVKVMSVHMKCTKNESALTSMYLLVE